MLSPQVTEKLAVALLTQLSDIVIVLLDNGDASVAYSIKGIQ